LNNNLLSIEDHEKCNDNISKQLEQYKNIKEIIDENKKVLDKYESNYKTYISKQNEASNYDKYYNLVDENKKILLKNNTELDNINKEIEQLSKIVSKDILSDITNEVNKLYNDTSIIKNTIDITNKQLSDVNKELDVLDNYIIEKQQKEKILFKYNTLNNKYKLYRTIFNNLPKELSKQIRKYISMFASNLYRKISNENVRIEILDDYEVILVDCIEQSKQKTLSQLSGGEQMSVAIAIRLAMLKQITNVRFYFMDEPTVNLDTERRTMVGEVVKDISQELRQLFVISHDDTFEAITDNNIKIIKNNNISVLDI
jgi:exonuclease SbcC